MTAPRTIPAQDRLAAEAFEVLAARKPDGSEPGKFRITAYTGAPVQRWYGSMVIDVAGIECPERLAILMDHDPAKRMGFATKITKDGGVLKLEGTLLENEHGATFSNESAQGFPFQASVGIEFLRVEELKAGDEKKVNGRSIRGPATVATKSRLRETSALACGADHQTTAEALSRDPASSQIEVLSHEDKEPTPMATPEEIKAAVEASQKADKERLGAIKAALGPDRAALALECFEAGMDAKDAKAKLADVLQVELAAEKKGRAAAEKFAANPGASFAGGKREQAGEATAEPAADKLGADQIEDLEPEAVLTIAKEVLASDKALRKEFKGPDGAKMLSAFARANAEGRVAIFEPLHGQYGQVDHAIGARS